MHVHVELSLIMNTLVLFSLLGCISKEKSFASCLCIFAWGCCRISLTVMKRMCRIQLTGLTWWFVTMYGTHSWAPKRPDTGNIPSNHLNKNCQLHFSDGEVCVYTEHKRLFILFGCAMYPQDSLIIPELCMFTPPFPSLNVVTAGLNRMQVSYSVSLHEREMQAGPSVSGLVSVQPCCSYQTH